MERFPRCHLRHEVVCFFLLDFNFYIGWWWWRRRVCVSCVCVCVCVCVCAVCVCVCLRVCCVRASLCVFRGGGGKDVFQCRPIIHGSFTAPAPRSPPPSGVLAWQRVPRDMPRGLCVWVSLADRRRERLARVSAHRRTPRGDLRHDTDNSQTAGKGEEAVLGLRGIGTK